jgi:hypothetical protein
VQRAPKVKRALQARRDPAVKPARQALKERRAKLALRERPAKQVKLASLGLWVRRDQPEQRASGARAV